MQEIISILKTLAESNTINFIIMVALLWVIVKKIRLGELFENASEKIHKNIETSEQTKQKSRETLELSKKRMENLPEEIASLEKTSKNKIQAFEDKIKRNTEQTISDINKSIKRVMDIEEKKVSNIITQKTSKDSIELAKNKIIDRLNKNPDLHNQFIQQSLDELDKVNIQ